MILEQFTKADKIGGGVQSDVNDYDNLIWKIIRLLFRNIDLT